MKTIKYMLALMLAIGAVMATSNVDMPDACKQLEKDILAKESYADLNNDGIVNLADVTIFAKHNDDEDYCQLALKPARIVTEYVQTGSKCSSGTSESTMWNWLTGEYQVEYDSPVSYLDTRYVKITDMRSAFRMVVDELCDLKYNPWVAYQENNECKKKMYDLI